MDERFDVAAADLMHQIGEIRTKFNNEKQIADSRHEFTMANIHKLLAQKEPQHPGIVHSATVHEAIVHGGTIHDAIVHSASVLQVLLKNLILFLWSHPKSPIF